MKVLVIEQSRVQQIILRALFTENRIEPDFVDSCEKAKAKIDIEKYDFVFAGYSLPDGTGVDIARYCRVKGMQEDALPGIVLLTTEENRSILNEALSAGVTRIINRANMPSLQVFIRELADSSNDFVDDVGAVLLIEDDKSVAMLFQQMIESTGSTCTISHDSQSALELISKQQFDLVIIDHYLGELVNGYDLLLSIQQMGGRQKRLPIMMISASDKIELRRQAFRHGASDYLIKPIDREELALRAKNLIARKKLMDRIEEQCEQLKKMALTDQLTSLYNRHFLAQYAPKRIAESRRHNSSLGIIICDLDHFKNINDTHGHDKGDEVLRGVAELLKSACRKEDTAIRLGGEEFLLVLPHCDQAGVIAKAEDIRQKLKVVKPAGLMVTGSFGATSLEADSSKKEFADLFHAADQAVYEAKESGRDKVVFRPVD